MFVQMQISGHFIMPTTQKNLTGLGVKGGYRSKEVCALFSCGWKIEHSFDRAHLGYLVRGNMEQLLYSCKESKYAKVQ